jgi:hypothetical protein
MNSKERFNIKKEQGSVNPAKIKEITLGEGVQILINNII